MKACWKHFKRFFLRLRFPVSLPEEVAEALGIYLPNFIRTEELVKRLISHACQPTRLMRFMPREKAEKPFRQASRCDRFARTTHFAYCFPEGWLEFRLHFDEEGRLRRLYMQHRFLKQEQGVEIRLRETSAVLIKSVESLTEIVA